MTLQVQTQAPHLEPSVAERFRGATYATAMVRVANLARGLASQRLLKSKAVSSIL
jgi:hypothetical protein